MSKKCCARRAPFVGGEIVALRNSSYGQWFGVGFPGASREGVVIGRPRKLLIDLERQYMVRRYILKSVRYPTFIFISLYK